MVALAGAQGDVIYFDAKKDYDRGDFFVVKGIGGLCLDDAKNGGVVAVQTRGLLAGVKKAQPTNVFERGDKIWASDGRDGVFDTNAANRELIGYAADDSSNGAATVDVLLALGIA